MLLVVKDVLVDLPDGSVTVTLTVAPLTGLPFEVTVTVIVAAEPFEYEALFVLTATERVGEGALTVSVTVVVCESDALVPPIVSV